MNMALKKAKKREQNRKYRDKYKKQIKKRRRLHYLKNKKKILKNNALYREKNREKMLKYFIDYYRLNKKKRKKYLKKNMKKIRTYNKKYSKEYYRKNKNKSWFKAYQKEYVDKNREKINNSRKAYRKRGYVKKQRQQYQRKNRKKITAYLMKKYYSSSQFKISLNMRTRVRSILKRGGCKKNCITLNYLGCKNFKTIVKHIEKQFKKGMTWKNYGKVWQLDHIKPFRSFDLSKEENVKKACNYKNLQPLLIKEHKMKTAEEYLLYKKKRT